MSLNRERIETCSMCLEEKEKNNQCIPYFSFVFCEYNPAVFHILTEKIIQIRSEDCGAKTYSLAHDKIRESNLSIPLLKFVK